MLQGWLAHAAGSAYESNCVAGHDVLRFEIVQATDVLRRDGDWDVGRLEEFYLFPYLDSTVNGDLKYHGTHDASY